MIKAIKKAVKWYLDVTATTSMLTPSGMIPLNYYK